MKLLRLVFAAGLSAMVGAACAQGNQESSGVTAAGAGGNGGEGGMLSSTSTSTSTSTTGGGSDGGVTDSGSDSSIPCSSQSDCSSLTNACNQGQCTGGFCVAVPSNEFGSCDDGKNCTDNDACQNGVCTGTPKFCPAPDTCHIGVCDEQTKSCVAMGGNDGASCDDMDPCTQSGKCQGGTCAKGPPKDCTFFNTACSIGKCDPVNGCQAQPINDGGFCDDGLGGQCSTGTCMAGQCVTHPLNDGAACNDMMFNECTTGTCTAGICKSNPVPDLTLCQGNIFDPCQQGYCQVGVCTAKPKNEGADCDDGMFNPCTQGKCTNGSCLSHGKPNGASCNDGHFCTLNDTCTAGFCSGTPNPCNVVGDVCHTAVCNDNAAACVLVPGNDGAACDDGNLCSKSETCLNGNCQGGLPDPATVGAPCDDHDGCTFATSCVAGTTTCGNPDPMQQITTCMTGDKCCPAGCNLVNDADCLWYVPGVQQNIPDAQLQGWQQCFKNTYAGAQDLPTVLANCNKAKLLMACRQVGSPTWALVAMAPRQDVLFDCGQQPNCTKQSNGVGWYYSNNYSWGFAQGGDAVNRNSCDFNPGNQVNPDLRLCWHTDQGQPQGQIDSGYRCGNNSLNGDASWERAVFQAD